LAGDKLRTFGLGVIKSGSSGFTVKEYFATETQRSRNQKRPEQKTNLTTKDTKSTKFIIKNIRTLHGLRELRGENFFRQMLHL
jgi:hypothetical protein